MNSPSAATTANRQASFYWDADQPQTAAAGGSAPQSAAGSSDALLLNEMYADERVSDLFEYQLVLSSGNANLVLNKLIGRTGRVELDLPGGNSKRYFHGIIAELSFASFRDNLAQYRAVLRPWLWLLTQASNNRIFQNESVPNIVDKVCRAHGFSDIDDKLGRTYKKRVYCVQYRESDFNFISRLMEEEGIYYYFKHEKGKHVLVMADSMTVADEIPGHKTVPYYPPDEHQHRATPHLDDWALSQTVRPGGYRLRDFDFTKPNTPLEVQLKVKKKYVNDEFERYEYPGHFFSINDGDSIVKARLDEAQGDHEILCGRGNIRALVPGYQFKLERFPRTDQNRSYRVLEVSHQLRLGGFDSGGVDAGDGFEYRCALTAMPVTQPLCPARKTPKPRVHGPQTATVVGEVAEEITTDQYGRVKVRFHWDRAAISDGTNSCWVRVAQAWAGSGWGAQFIPRKGQEVLIEFLEGDPDRPIITGSVYNAANMPPYALPTNKTQSGIKTRSSKGANATNFNEIRFEDKKGAEELYLHAEKDMKVEVENDRTKNVGKNETVTIGQNRNHTVDGTDTQRVKKTQDITIDEKRSLYCKKDELRDISEGSEQKIGGKWTSTAQLGVDIISPVEIKLKSGTLITLDAPTIVRTDDCWISKTTHSLALTAFAMGFSGVTVDFKVNATGVNGVNIGVNAVNLGYNRYDASKSQFTAGVDEIKVLKGKLEAQKLEVALNTIQLDLQKKSLDIVKAGLTIKS